jgi:predicted RND superfamily exporter protein
MVTLLGSWLDEIVDGQRNGVLASSVVICLLMMLGLRSAKVGLWSMIPNLFPLVVLWGCMALVWNPVDSDTLVVAMMAIGIGVDDTVHFLMRYRVEADRTASTSEALHRTFAFAGRAIVTTTVILGLGFLPLAGSSYIPLRFVGILLPGSLVLALLADLLLVPALVQVGWMRFSQQGARGEPAGEGPPRA